MTETRANRPTEELTEEELSEIARRPASVANAIPVGVTLDREKVEAQLRLRKKKVKARAQAGEGLLRKLGAIEEKFPLSAGVGEAPVLWEASPSSTRHLLATGGWENLGTLREVLLRHAEAHGRFWRVAVIETEEEQLRALSVDVSGARNCRIRERLLLVVENPETQEVLSLLTAFAAKTKASWGAKPQLHLAVLTDNPAALPSALIRHLGFRVAFAGTSRSDSRDVVGDGSAATLPSTEHFRGAAVVYDEWLANDPEHGTHRVDLPGRRYGRRRDAYVGSGTASEGEGVR